MMTESDRAVALCMNGPEWTTPGPKRVPSPAKPSNSGAEPPLVPRPARKDVP